jgi:hypothetical protein
MNRRSLAGLILINAVLLASLVVAGFSPQPAAAQFGTGGGEYLMIAGDVTGRNSQAAVYIIDMRSGNVAAIMFNGSNNTLEFIAGRNVSEDTGRPANQR